jgi:hypothetical protein
MQRSKSTAHFTVPRTRRFSRLMASGGHSLAQTWQPAQKSSAPKASGASACSGQVGLDGGQPEAGAELAVDQRAVLAQFAEAAGDCGRQQVERADPGAGVGHGLVALAADPVRQPVHHAGAAVVLVADFELAFRVLGARRHQRQARVVHGVADDDQVRQRGFKALVHPFRPDAGDADQFGFAAGAGVALGPRAGAVEDEVPHLPWSRSRRWQYGDFRGQGRQFVRGRDRRWHTRRGRPGT